MEQMKWKREQMAKTAPPSPTAAASPPSPTAATEHQIHVRGIGVDGWDGTEEGTGSYENEEALEEIFSVFGSFVQATIRHRIADGKNTSWALVTMGDAESVDRALSEPSVMAGTNKLVLNRFSAKQAAASTGAMKQVRMSAKDKIRQRSELKLKQKRALDKAKMCAPAATNTTRACAWMRFLRSCDISCD